MPGRTLTTGLTISGGTLNLSAAVFKKSSHSGPNGCVEVAILDGRVAMRDSKHRDGPVLVFASEDWEKFIGELADQQFRMPVPTPVD
jgi:hypothetical protein